MFIYVYMCIHMYYICVCVFQPCTDLFFPDTVDYETKKGKGISPLRSQDNTVASSPLDNMYTLVKSAYILYLSYFVTPIFL